MAQALDYASWVADLTADRIVQIYGRFSQGGSLDADFQQRFGIVAGRRDPYREQVGHRDLIDEIWIDLSGFVGRESGALDWQFHR